MKKFVGPIARFAALLFLISLSAARDAGPLSAAGANEQACSSIAEIKQFPLASTQITIARFNADGAVKAGDTPLPAHCQVQGVINPRVGVDGVKYGDMFEVRMPVNWNGRFMFQGGGGTKGALPPAYGIAGTASPTLAMGYAVASNDGGHETSLLTSPEAFGLDPQARAAWGYEADDSTTRTAKFLINYFYGRMPDHSYHVGCSLGGQEGMQFSERFPDYFDGIVAGDPIFDNGSVSLSELNGLQAIAAIVPKNANGDPEYYKSFSQQDRDLFTRAILSACDKLDGLADGVIDNFAACKFDPATFVFPETHQSLKCRGAKTDQCLGADQINALKRINDGPRTSAGKPVVLPSGSTVVGYPYDASFMERAGIPARLFGTETNKPGDISAAVAQIPLLHFGVPDANFHTLNFNFDTDVKRMTKGDVIANSTDISAFKKHGGKILYYHGLSDPGPAWTNTVNYYNELIKKNGGLTETQKFARLYLVPNMNHCGGGPSTDQFDMLTPLVNWVEKGVVPTSIVASGNNFKTTPTKRSRPLCSYPQHAQYSGPANGDISDAKNYSCVAP